MQFMLIAYDDTDEGALGRRLAVREAHLRSAKEMFVQGKMVYGAGILDDAGSMIGSMIIYDASSRSELEQWLSKDPYVTGKVWKTMTIHRAQVPPFCIERK